MAELWIPSVRVGEPSKLLSQDLAARARALRHDLHRHPELGFQERRTQAKVKEWLTAHGWQAREIAGTGLVAERAGGAGDGPTIAVRADLDALPIRETTELEYRSVHDGVAHKCGHDGHTSILCALAAVLDTRLAKLRGKVRLLFQPAEEGATCGGGGGRIMVEQGALEGVDQVFGLHNWPGFPKGEVRVKSGTVMAQEHRLAFTIRGRGGQHEDHGAANFVLDAHGGGSFGLAEKNGRSILGLAPGSPWRGYTSSHSLRM